MDYGKYVYRQKKIEQKHKKHQFKSEVKGIRFSLRIGVHDMEIKANQARRFLLDRNSVKVQLVFRGREAAFRDLALEKLNSFAGLVSDVSKIEEYPKRQGMSMFMTLVPVQKES